MPSPGTSSSQYLEVFTSLKALQTPSCRVFKEASLHRHDWLNHWPLVNRSISSSSPHPGVPWGGGTATFHSLIWPLATSPHPPRVTWLTQTQIWWRGLLQTTKDSPFTPTTEEVTSVLEALCQKPRQRLNIYFLLYHNFEGGETKNLSSEVTCSGTYWLDVAKPRPGPRNSKY